MSRAWHLVTCESTPPQIGGVSDFTRAIARGIAATGDRVHVWHPAHTAGAAPMIPGVETHADLGHVSPSDLRRVGRALDAHGGERRLLVQWVPHGYGWRSLNLPFALWLAARAWRKGDEIDLVVHEPYNEFSAHPARFAAALVHRVMLIVAVAAARRVWVSMPGWEGAVRSYMVWKRPVSWLPVPSPIAFVQDHQTVARLKRELAPNGEPLVGHFSTHSPLVTALLAPALERVLQMTNARAVLIGRGSAEFLREFLATHPRCLGRVAATDVVAPALASTHVQACDVMLQPYPDGVSSRRTTIVALLAHGRPVVTNAGALTDEVWRNTAAVKLVSEPDPQLLSLATAALLIDNGHRRELSCSARQLYDHVFDTTHAISALVGSDDPAAVLRERALVH